MTADGITWQPGDRVQLRHDLRKSDRVGTVAQYWKSDRGSMAGYIVDWGAGPVEGIAWQADQLVAASDTTEGTT